MTDVNSLEDDNSALGRGRHFAVFGVDVKGGHDVVEQE